MENWWMDKMRLNKNPAIGKERREEKEKVVKLDIESQHLLACFAGSFAFVLRVRCCVPCEFVVQRRVMVHCLSVCVCVCAVGL